jgi:hypothetical protein
MGNVLEGIMTQSANEPEERREEEKMLLLKAFAINPQKHLQSRSYLCFTHKFNFFSFLIPWHEPIQLPYTQKRRSCPTVSHPCFIFQSRLNKFNNTVLICL